MAWPRLKTAGVVSATILLAIGVAVIVTISSTGSLSQGALRLPVGKGKPAVSLGKEHGLILASDGSLWAWGSDFIGWPVLGLGNVGPQPRLRRIGNDTNWVSISAGVVHNVAIKSDGTLWAWGENLDGQFGQGTPGRLNMKASVPVPAAPGNEWKQAVAGGVHTLALKKDGTLWAWGVNWAGTLGTGTTSNSAVPVQVGAATSWVKVWAGNLQSVGLQSDGSLWYWGEDPDPSNRGGAGHILIPKRISPDTNWTDVGFGNDTVFAIKADGTLWTWGRTAHFYTGSPNLVLDATPMRLGTNSDWAFVSACGLWWCQGLIKKDGSLWLMDASGSLRYGPKSPYKPVRFRRVDLRKDVVAYVAGAAHVSAGGGYLPIGVALTRDGEVWTWGLMLGEPPTFASILQNGAVPLANQLGFKVQPVDPGPVIRRTPWRLPHEEP